MSSQRPSFSRVTPPTQRAAKTQALVDTPLQARPSLSAPTLGVALLLSALLAPLSALQRPAKAQPTQGTPGQDLESFKSKGLLYFRKKMMVQAREQFDLAFKTPKGPQDFIVVYYRGLLSYRQLKLETAFEMAELAVKIAKPDTLDAQDAKSLLGELKGQFSYVEINTAKEETNKQGRIYLETKRRILNKQKREQFESIRTRFRSTDVTLPTKIYLPYGNYTANNVPFVIKKGTSSAPSVDVFLHILKGKDEGNSNVMLYTGLGVTATAALGVATYFFLKDPPVREVRGLSFSQVSGAMENGK